MNIEDILTEQGILASLYATSGRHAVRSLLQAWDESVSADMFRALDFEDPIVIKRSKVVIYSGISDAVDSPALAFASLTQPLELAHRSYDGVTAVDIVVMMISPAQSSGGAHLRTLSMLTRKLKDLELCASLRGCGSSAAVYGLLLSERTLQDAA